MVTCKKATFVRNYLEVYWPCAGGLSTVNTIGTQLRDPINSGLTMLGPGTEHAISRNAECSCAVDEGVTASVYIHAGVGVCGAETDHDQHSVDSVVPQHW